MTDESVDRKKKVLFYRALSKLSDECELPKLTPECPFYARQDDGSAVCGEECRDILSDDLSPALDVVGEYNLGNEMRAIRRPKPRRGPKPEDRPFDAAEIYLRERSRGLDAWSLPALIGGLRSQFAWLSLDSVRDDPPNFDRAQALMEVLEKRGVDAEAVVRQGFVSLLIGSVMWHVYRAIESNEEDYGWLTLLKVIAPEDELRSISDSGNEGQIIEYVAPKLIDHVVMWSLYAPLDDLLHHRAPESPYNLHELWPDVPPRNFELQWLVDRFTETYLYNWHPVSWTSEWRWIHSSRPGCCSPAQMRDRVIDNNELARILAEYACEIEDKDKAREFGDDSRIHVAQFLDVALGAIESGNVSEAVSMYRAIVRLVPDDWQATNNLGFCLIPIDPAEAIEYLERSIGAPQRPPQLLPMTHLNLALANFRRGKLEEALESIRRARSVATLSIGGYMWAPDEPQLMLHLSSLQEYADSLEALVSEALRAANNGGFA